MKESITATTQKKNLRRSAFPACFIKNSTRNKRGTTLLECVLALAVFTAVSVMIAMMLSTASILQRTSTDTDRTLNKVSDEAELAITKPVTATEGTGGELVFYDGSTEVAKQQVRFVKHTAPVAGTAAPSTQHVTVWRMGVPATPPAGS